LKKFLTLIIILFAFGCNEIKIVEPNANANADTNTGVQEYIVEEIVPEKEIVSQDLVEWIYKGSNLPKTTAKEISIFIYENCKYPHLIHSIIMRESNFKIFSHRKDTKVYGLGQIAYYEETSDLRLALKKYVGEVNNDMSKYTTDILAHVGYLYIIEKNNS